MKARTILALLICCCASLAQAGPLDDAAVLYRAAAYSPTNTIIPNEGTRTEPLQLGPTLGEETEDPVFVHDPEIGDYLDFSINQSRYASSPLPVSVLNGSITFAVRVRPNALWAQGKILNIIDNYGLGGELKHFYLTQNTSNKYLSRFWENTQLRNQIAATGATSVSLTRTDTVVVVWDAVTLTNSLYLNGVLEATAVAANPRSDAVSSPLYAPTFGQAGGLTACVKMFSMAVWERPLTEQEITDLTDDPVWKNETPPPPPPPPGELRVLIDGVEYPGSLILIDGVPVLPEGPSDKIVEVITE